VILFSRYYGLIAIRKTTCKDAVIVKFVDCEWPMYAFPLILVVTHYLLWFESLLILNNPVSNYLFIIMLSFKMLDIKHLGYSKLILLRLIFLNLK